MHAPPRSCLINSQSCRSWMRSPMFLLFPSNLSGPLFWDVQVRATAFKFLSFFMWFTPPAPARFFFLIHQPFITFLWSPEDYFSSNPWLHPFLFLNFSSCIHICCRCTSRFCLRVNFYPPLEFSLEGIVFLILALTPPSFTTPRCSSEPFIVLILLSYPIFSLSKPRNKISWCPSIGFFSALLFQGVGS